MKTTATLTTLALTAILSLVAASAHAAIISTADGNGADTMIRQDGATLQDTNYGSDGRIWARSSTSNNRFDAIFLRFDISDYASGSFTGPAADLSITKWRDTDTGETVNVYGLNDGVGDNWGESAITYNNAPGIDQTGAPDGANDVVSGDTTLLGTLDLTGDEGDIFTLSNANVLTFLNSDTDGLVTFIMARDPNNNGIDDIASKEEAALDNITGSVGDFAPTLEFEATFIPEPASFLLLALGGLAFFRRSWRR
jgi:hypothetical protein